MKGRVAGSLLEAQDVARQVAHCIIHHKAMWSALQPQGAVPTYGTRGAPRAGVPQSAIRNVATESRVSARLQWRKGSHLGVPARSIRCRPIHAAASRTQARHPTTIYACAWWNAFRECYRESLFLVHQHGSLLDGLYWQLVAAVVFSEHHVLILHSS